MLVAAVEIFTCNPPLENVATCKRQCRFDRQ
jgi:hypothetical protein